MARVTLIDPRFEFSHFWRPGMLRKRALLPSACLPLLAALTPAEHHVTIVDENVETLDFDRIARSDIVGLTGISSQQARQREIAAELKRRHVFTVAGGPWITVKEDALQGLADVVFIGEADETWPQFMADWDAGRPQPRYEQATATDMSRLPCPRLDLLKTRHYLFGGGVQFSRGCPHQCEFCDVSLAFGRNPRLKTWPQVNAELEGLLAQRVEAAFILDSNVIGNKELVKALLRELVKWQRVHGYPLGFFASASLELAEDPELLQLMADSNVQSVFVGIESTNAESLRETNKLQNLRPRPMLDRVRTIQAAGLDVMCGMIVGFDHDDPSIFAAERRFVRDSGVSHAMVSMLTALPKTRLYARLQAEGRLTDDDLDLYGTNVVPLHMTRAELRDGCVRLMQEIYEPTAFLERLDRMFLSEPFAVGASRAAWLRDHPWSWLKAESVTIARLIALYWLLMHHVREPDLRRMYRRHFFGLLRRKRPAPWVLLMYLIKCVSHCHCYALAQQPSASSRHVSYG